MVNEKMKEDVELKNKLETKDWFRHQTVPILAECGDNTKLIEYIRNYGSKPYNKQ